MAGLFGDLDVDIASAETLPDGIPVGVFDGEVVSVEVKPGSKDPKAKYLVIGYKAPGWPFPSQRWHHAPEGKPESWDDTIQDAKGETEKVRNERARSYLKQAIMALGVPEARVNTVSPDELKGIKVVITTKQNGDYVNISRVTLPKESGVTLPTSGGGGAKKADDSENPFDV